MSSVAVVIPVVQSTLKDFEALSLKQCLKVLGARPIYFVAPESLDLTEILQKCDRNIEITRFSDDYFRSIADYNRLMTSVGFYSAFNSFDFMLLYQLDAYVFEDTLDAWCAKGFDYIGAPAFHAEGFESLGAEGAAQYAAALASHRLVFNGGLSLRKNKAIVRLLKLYNSFYPSWKGNEDMLFSLDSTRLFPLKPFIKLPDWKTALAFSFEKSPAASYAITDDRLPFGCHAWGRYDPVFWQPFIK